jgi:hypothetical protein
MPSVRIFTWGKLFRILLQEVSHHGTGFGAVLIGIFEK